LADGRRWKGVAAFVGRLPNSIRLPQAADQKQNKMTYAAEEQGTATSSPPTTRTSKAAASTDWAKSFT
jgi:phosphate transport system substrate-binding protein